MSRRDLVYEVVNPTGLAEADLAVAVISRAEAACVALPTMKCALGLTRFYPGLRSVIINCDNASQDGTREAFFQAEAETPRIYVSSPPGLTGKGANIQNALALAARLRVKALAVIDANLLSVKTTWIKSLFDPLLRQEAEYVAPMYVRHKNETLLTRWLAYPLLRAVLGRRVLQPVAVDHAFSRRLIEIYDEAGFEVDDAGHKSDLRFLALAVRHQARICQSFMAQPRVSAGSGPGDDLAGSFVRLARSIFEMMAETRDFWPSVGRSRPTALAGADEEIKNPPPHLELDRVRLTAEFVALGRERRAAWERCLPPTLTAELERALDAAAKGRTPLVSTPMWRAGLFQASAAHYESGGAGEEAAALIPAFLARCLTSLETDQTLTARQLAAQTEEVALGFEQAKPELTARWKL